MIHRFFCLLIFALFFGSISCSESEHTGLNADGSPIIVVPVPPYAYLVEQLTGDSVEVFTLVDEKDDPHSYSPTPREQVKLSRAMVYFTADLPFEPSLLRSLKNARQGPAIIDIVDNLKLREFAEGEHEHHSEDEHSGHHNHGKEYDPHVWLSPPLYAEQAAVIARELQKRIPDKALSAEIAARAKVLIAEINALNDDLKKSLAPMKGQSFYTYHGAFGYLAEAYGLKQEAIEFAGRSPQPKQIVKLIEHAKADGVKLILVQPQFDQSSAKTLAGAIGGTVVPINPMAKNVPDNLRKIAKLVMRSKQG